MAKCSTLQRRLHKGHVSGTMCEIASSCQHKMRRANTAKDKPETTMTRFFIAGIAALFLATGTAHARPWAVFHCGKDLDMTVAWLPPKYFDDHKEHYFDFSDGEYSPPVAQSSVSLEGLPRQSGRRTEEGLVPLLQRQEMRRV